MNRRIVLLGILNDLNNREIRCHSGVALTDDCAKATVELLAARRQPTTIPRILRTSRVNGLFAFNQLSKKLADPELCCLERAPTGSCDLVKAANTPTGPLFL
jgi:hypothetical protein